MRNEKEKLETLYGLLGILSQHNKTRSELMETEINELRDIIGKEITEVAKKVHTPEQVPAVTPKDMSEGGINSDYPIHHSVTQGTE